MKYLVCILASLLLGNVIAQPINQASIITHSYNLDRDGLWEIPTISNTLRETEKTNVIVSLNGDISGAEYQFKHETETEKTTIQKLFYIADINDDLSLQIGKFIENWQLGYAFNPLAVTDPYHPADNEDDLNEKLGINAIAMRYGTGDAYLDFYISDDKKERNNVRSHGYKSQAARLNYILNDETDLTFVIHKKEDVKVGFGLGFRYIANNNLKFYGSSFTRKGTTLPSGKLPTPTISDRTNDNTHYTRSMLGGHWVSAYNMSIIAEISQDDRGMNDQAWKTYKVLTPESGLNLGLVRPNGLRQRYLFLRLSKIIGDHEFSLNRRTGIDYSALNTLKWTYDIIENLQLNALHSETTGSTNSEYKTFFPDQRITSLILRYNLDF